MALSVSITIGLVLGLGALLVLRRQRQPMWWLLPLFGAGGSVLGWMVARVVTGYHERSVGPFGVTGSVIGAVLVLLLCHRISKPPGPPLRIR